MALTSRNFGQISLISSVIGTGVKTALSPDPAQTLITSVASKGVSLLLSSVGISIPFLGLMISAFWAAYKDITRPYSEEEDYTGGIYNFAQLTEDFTMAERGVFRYINSGISTQPLDPEWVLLHAYGHAISEWVPTTQKLLPTISKGITEALESSKVGPVTDDLFAKLSPYLPVLEYFAVMYHAADNGWLVFEGEQIAVEGWYETTKFKEQWGGWEIELGKPLAIMENVRDYLEKNGIFYPRPLQIATELQEGWTKWKIRVGYEGQGTRYSIGSDFYPDLTIRRPTLIQYIIQLGQQAVVQPSTTLISTSTGIQGGTTITDTQFITSLYQNVLRREPDSEGLAYWVDDYVTSGRDQEWTLEEFIAAAQYHGEEIYSTTLPSVSLAGFPIWGWLVLGGIGLSIIGGKKSHGKRR